MRLNDERTDEVLVARDPERHLVEVRVGRADDAAARVVRLTVEEARRFAALVLFEAARVGRPRIELAPAYHRSEEQSA